MSFTCWLSSSLGTYTSLVSPTVVLTLLTASSNSPWPHCEVPTNYAAKSQRQERKEGRSLPLRVSASPESYIKGCVLEEKSPSSSLENLQEWEIISNPAPSGLVLFPGQISKSVLGAATGRSVQTNFLSDDNQPSLQKNKQCFVIDKNQSSLQKASCAWVEVWADCQATWSFNSLTQQRRWTKQTNQTGIT